jgi:hypothetical protein
MASAASAAATGASNGYPQPTRPEHRRRPSRADGWKIGRQLIELIQRASASQTQAPTTADQSCRSAARRSIIKSSP